MKNVLKRCLPDLVAVILFAILAFAYFYPADTEGRILYQHDTSAGAGAGQEASEYFERTGERTRWTNSLFGGMPTYQISPSYDSTRPMSVLENVWHLWLPDYVWHLFAYLLGFYVLLRAFDYKWHLAALGSVLWAFSTYFLIIIAAGHMWKVVALTYLPPLIGGLVLAYRGRYLPGLVVTALFTAFELKANHYQMTYYFMFVMLAMAVAFLAKDLHERQWQRWLKATGVAIVGGLLGVMVNISNIYHTWEYSKQTMRGGSELKTASKGTDSGAANGLTRDYITQYSYGIGETWSLLIPNIQGGASMRADADKGTAIFPLMDSSAAKKMASDPVKDSTGETVYVRGADGQPTALTYGQLFSQMPRYWGDGGTMGPVYVGAIVILLVVLAMLVVRDPMKWALLAVTVMSVMLAWGRNYMGPTDFFIDHVPMYDKFRTVESILVIAEFTLPLLAIMGLKRISDDPGVLFTKLTAINVGGALAAMLILIGFWSADLFKWLGLLLAVVVMAVSTLRYYGVELPKGLTALCEKRLPLSPLALSLLLTGGVLLLFAVFPSTFFNFTTEADKQQFEGLGAALQNIAGVRRSIFTTDCWRSLAYILGGCVVLWLYGRRRLKTLPAIGILAVLCLIDLWTVNKEYLNDTMFRDASIRQTTHQQSDLDRQLLQDKTPDYRVLNMATAYPSDDQRVFFSAYSNAFNENQTSYYHKSIGGYHAAKLQRYQDIIDSCLVDEMYTVYNALPMANYSYDTLSVYGANDITPVLNMLNTRYVVLGKVVRTQEGADVAPVPVLNTQAYGNAWMVDSIGYVGSANDELKALRTYDLRHQAVADKQFENTLGKAAPQDSTTTVKLTSYEPNRLRYSVDSKAGGVLVFSEIYYPGWKAVVDGNKEAELGRVNYVLRAMHIEPGHHEVELTFFQSSIGTTETVAYASMGLILLIAVATIVLELLRRKKAPAATEKQ